ncbi:BA14K family protein [Stappia sp.]|uniref:BA14K family protein n=1 Tax=Stappia sp. TaxID=1870903 RepID=UPI003C7BEF40
MTTPVTLKSLTSRVLVATLAGAMLLPSFSVAEAGGGKRHWRDHGGQHQAFRPNRGNRHQNRHRNKNDDIGAALAIGVIGLAAGAMIGSALSGPQYIDPEPIYEPRHPRGYGPVYPDPVYDNRGYRPAPVYDNGGYRPAPPVVVGYDRPEPWTREWYRYCSTKYRSFNPNTGRFTTYSGKQKLCR